MLGPQVGDDGLGQGQLAALAVDAVVLEPVRAGVHEDAFFGAVGRGGPAEGEVGQAEAEGGGAAADEHLSAVHGGSLRESWWEGDRLLCRSM